MAMQQGAAGNSIGRLYAANIIQPWTRDLTSPDGRPQVELYWNVSTWNPYQVVLVRTRLTGRAP